MAFGCEETLSSENLQHVHEDPILLFSTTDSSQGSSDCYSFNPNPRYANEIQHCPQLCEHRDDTFVWMLNVLIGVLFDVDLQSEAFTKLCSLLWDQLL